MKLSLLKALNCFLFKLFSLSYSLKQLSKAIKHNKSETVNHLQFLALDGLDTFLDSVISKSNDFGEIVYPCIHNLRSG